MTIPAVAAGTIIDPAWGNAVTDQLNDLPLKIVTGKTAVTFDGAGAGTLNFGYTFGASPVLCCNIIVGTSTQRTVTIASLATSSAGLFTASNNAAASGSLTISWIAVGIP